MESLTLFLSGLDAALSPQNLLFALIGCLVGTLVGVLPGVGSAAGMAILLPLTFQLPGTSAIIMLAAIFYGSYYGGTITTILMNVPGEASSVVTVLDGHQMARQGRGGAALSIAAIGSFIGGTIAVLGLVFAAPTLTDLALSIGPPEFFALLCLALAMLVVLAGDSLIRALVMGVVGLLLATVGMDPALGTPRFTFGMVELIGGVNFVPVLMGLFGLSEVLLNVKNPIPRMVDTRLRSLMPTRKDFKDSAGSIGRGTGIGFVLGLIPGTTEVLSSFLSYSAEKAVSRHPERFGTGAIEGVAGPETANNAHSNAALIPLFTLGIPGSASVAILFSAFIIHGLTPGPLLFQQRPEIAWTIIASMVVGNGLLLILNLPLIGIWVRLLRVPYSILAPVIVLFICIGSYTVSNNAFDVWVMLIAGVIGFALRRLDFPMSPVALTLIVGPLLEQALRQSLTISQGDLGILFSSGVSAALLTLAVLVVVVSLGRLAMLSVRERRASSRRPRGDTTDRDEVKTK